MILLMGLWLGSEYMRFSLRSIRSVFRLLKVVKRATYDVMSPVECFGCWVEIGIVTESVPGTPS